MANARQYQELEVAQTTIFSDKSCYLEQEDTAPRISDLLRHKGTRNTKDLLFVDEKSTGAVQTLHGVHFKSSSGDGLLHTAARRAQPAPAYGSIPIASRCSKKNRIKSCSECITL